MNHLKLSIIALILLAILCGAAAAIIIQMYVPMQGTILPEPSFTMKIDNALWTSGQTCDWGDLTRGETYYVTLNVTNTSPYPCTVTVTAPNLPADYSLAWLHNNTSIQPNTYAQANLELSIPSTAAPGAFAFNMYVNLEGP